MIHLWNGKERIDSLEFVENLTLKSILLEIYFTSLITSIVLVRWFLLLTKRIYLCNNKKDAGEEDERMDSLMLIISLVCESSLSSSREQSNFAERNVRPAFVVFPKLRNAVHACQLIEIYNIQTKSINGSYVSLIDRQNKQKKKEKRIRIVKKPVCFFDFENKIFKSITFEQT